MDYIVPIISALPPLIIALATLYNVVKLHHTVTNNHAILNHRLSSLKDPRVSGRPTQ